jgi:hypothetical protein
LDSRREVPTYKKMDHVLASVEWEEKFPLVVVRALTHAGSDHRPLLVDMRSLAHLEKRNHFSFKLSWLGQEGFYELVKEGGCRGLNSAMS